MAFREAAAGAEAAAHAGAFITFVFRFDARRTAARR
jgi:hypothetical protein